MLDDMFDEGFGGGSWDEDVAIDGEFEAEEMCDPDEVLDGFVLGGAFDEFAECGSFERAGGSIEIEVEVDSGAIEDMSEEHFGGEAWGVDFFMIEVFLGPVEEGSAGPVVLIGMGGVWIGHVGGYCRIYLGKIHLACRNAWAKVSAKCGRRYRIRVFHARINAWLGISPVYQRWIGYGLLRFDEGVGS